MRMFDKLVEKVLQRSPTITNTLELFKLGLQELSLLSVAVHELARIVKQHDEFISGIQSVLNANAAKATASVRKDVVSMEFPPIDSDKNTKSN
jgi:hypothetical protein